MWITILSWYVSKPMHYGDWEEWWCEHSMSFLQVFLSVEGAKNVSWPWISPLQAFFGKFNIYGQPFSLATTQSHCFMGIGMDGGLSALCHSCGFACQERVLNTFLDPGYLRSKDRVV